MAMILIVFNYEFSEGEIQMNDLDTVVTRIEILEAARGLVILFEDSARQVWI